MITTPVSGLPPTRKLVGIGLALALGAGACFGLAAYLANPAATGKTEIIAPAPFTVAITGIGDLVPARRQMIAPPYSSKLDSVAPEGSEVKAGDVVARLNTQEIEEKKQEEELRLATLDKDAEVSTLEAKRDRQKLLTERRAAADRLALEKLNLAQMQAGTPKAEIAELTIRAEGAAATLKNVQAEVTLQEGLLEKGALRPLDVAKARVSLAEARKGYQVAATALAIAKNGYPDAQVEAQRLTVLKAQNALTLIDGKLAHALRTRELAAKVARADQEFARARILAFTHRIAEANLRAPSKGIVVMNAVWAGGSRKKLQAGDEARENTAFMEIADVSGIFIKTPIQEVDIGRVKVGMPVKIRVQSLNKTFSGKLKSIGVLATEKPDLVNREGAPKVFEGLIETAERSSAFRPGMTVDIELVVSELKSALSVPNPAIFIHQGKPHVWVQPAGGAPVRREVVTGAFTDKRTVIDSGLVAGEPVLTEATP